MNANIKVRYIGTNPIFTTNKIYQVLAMDGSSGSSARYIILEDAGFPYVVSPFGGVNADVELVSVTYPGEIQLYP